MILISHKFICDKCGEEFVGNEFRYHLDFEAPRPNPPESWFSFEGLLFCGKHALSARLVDRAPGAGGLVFELSPRQPPPPPPNVQFKKGA